MSKRKSVWITAIIIGMAVGLVGQAAVWAQPESFASPDAFALGYLSPEQDNGHLYFFEEERPATIASSPTSAFADEVVRLINLERRAEGLAPFKVSVALTASAEAHSAFMRDHECFAHQCPGEPPAADRVCQAGHKPYGWGTCFVGETIGAGFSDPASIVAGWMASPGHRDILLHGTLREVGVGYVSGGYYDDYWTADFGSQPDVIPVFINYEDPTSGRREVTLTLTNEEVSGWGGMDFAHEVMISNDPNFEGAQWELYTPNKSWVLDDVNGEATVYVKFRDPTGNEVVSIDTILLDLPLQYDLDLSTNELVFIYQVGSGFWGPATGRVQVLNAAGSASMSWNATGGAAWLGVLAGNGSTPGELVVSVAGFETKTLGDSQAVITVLSPEAADSPEEVTITVRAVDEVHRVMLPFVVKSED